MAAPDHPGAARPLQHPTYPEPHRQTGRIADMTSQTRPRLLDPFVSPGAIAIIGLSRSAIGSPVSVHTTLLDMGYEGGIYIVNPSMTSAPGATAVSYTHLTLPTSDLV